jgi:hypothetical protein
MPLKTCSLPSVSPSILPAGVFTIELRLASDVDAVVEFSWTQYKGVVTKPAARQPTTAIHMIK